jgi:cell division protein FtsZ
MGHDENGHLKFQLIEETCDAKIRVIGIGRGGGRALDRMIEAGVESVDFIAVDTDLQVLNGGKAPVRLHIGRRMEKAKGFAGRPEFGKESALEATEELIAVLEGADLVFLVAGLGGCTGTGAAPVIANLAAELGVLVIAVVSLPFEWEGRVRMRQAEEGLEELKSAADTVIVIPNQRLLDTADSETTMKNAFRIVDDVFLEAVRGVSDLITKAGLINLDSEDLKSIMKDMGTAFMGTGTASGKNRIMEAAHKAIFNPLLIDTPIEGARGVLVNITGGEDLPLLEIAKASQLIRKMAHPEANIIFGMVVDQALANTAKVMVLATGFGSSEKNSPGSEKDGPNSKPYRKSPRAIPPLNNHQPAKPAPVEPETQWDPPEPEWEKKIEYYERPIIERIESVCRRWGRRIKAARKAALSEPAPDANNTPLPEEIPDIQDIIVSRNSKIFSMKERRNHGS